MNKKSLLLSLPLTLLVLPPYLSGTPGLHYPLFWLAALLLIPFFTAPLLAGEAAAGTDQLLLTGPLPDRRLLLMLAGRGALNLGALFVLPVSILSLLLLFRGTDPGKILFFIPLFSGGILFLAALGLAVSAFCQRTAAAWVLSYLLLLPLNFFPFLLPKWTDPLFEAYLPFAVLFLLPLCFLLFLEAAGALLAWKREEPRRKKRLPPLACLFILSFLSARIPGGMDLTFSGQIRANRVTARAVRQLEDPLHVRWYRTSNYGRYRDGLGSVEAFLFSLRLKAGRSLHYRRERLSDDDIDRMGRERGWTVQTVENGGVPEPFYSVLEIEYRGRIETLPLLYNPLIGEEQFLAALRRLESGTVPRAALITGRSDKGLAESWTILRGSLEEYFSVEDFTGRADSLAAENPDILFVLGDRDLSAWEVSRIGEYVREGGAALITLSPFIIDPERTDRIVSVGKSPMITEMEQLGIHGGDSFIVDPDRGLYLTSGSDGPPDFYPLWFSTGGKGLFDYTALWSVPLYYTGEEEPLWRVESSAKSLLTGPLGNITPSALRESPLSGQSSYTTCLSLALGKGKIIVLSGDQSLSDIMAVADRNMGNSAWIQSLAFFLSGNRELLDLRRKSAGGAL